MIIAAADSLPTAVDEAMLVDFAQANGDQDLVMRIVRLAAPYAAFPAELRSDTDVLVVTRTWYFEPGDTLRSE